MITAKDVGSFLGKASAAKLKKKLGKKGYSEHMRSLRMKQTPKGRTKKTTKK